MKITRFEEIDGWILGRSLTREVYEASRKHFDELYLLAAQINAKVGGFIQYLKSCKQERKTP